MTRKTMIEDIIASEWRMFDLVQNIGQRASCQDDYDTFRKMRLSQLDAWTDDVIADYWADHQTANLRGSNLIERKYAYMMRYTAPEYYEAELKPYLPAVSAEKEKLAGSILAVYMQWYREARARWPYFVMRGRPADEEEAENGITSVDIYMMGELLSYSSDTLKSFLAMTESKKASGINMVEEIYDNTARQYGYDSLEEAEAELKRRQV